MADSKFAGVFQTGGNFDYSQFKLQKDKAPWYSPTSDAEAWKEGNELLSNCLADTKEFMKFEWCSIFIHQCFDFLLNIRLDLDSCQDLCSHATLSSNELWDQLSDLSQFKQLKEAHEETELVWDVILLMSLSIIVLVLVLACWLARKKRSSGVPKMSQLRLPRGHGKYRVKLASGSHL